MDMEIKEFRYLAAKPLTRSTVVGLSPRQYVDRLTSVP